MITKSPNLWYENQENRFSSTVSPWGKLRLFLFSLNSNEASFAKRGFQSNNISVQAYLEEIGATFLFGYHKVIAMDNPTYVINNLQDVEVELQGFAFEGAAMGLTLLDWLMPWRKKRIPEFLAQQSDKHIYMVYVRLGWALARIPGSLNQYLAKLTNQSLSFPDSLLGWLAIDGYGFHQGYFAWQKYLENQKIPQELTGFLP